MARWIWKKSDKIKYITIPEWTRQGVNIGFTARHGGESAAPFDSLNMGLHVSDDSQKVLANRRSMFNIFNTDISQVVCAQQVHNCQVAVVDKAHAGMGAEIYDTVLPGIDAMVTNTPGIMLAAFYADCIPIYFFDPAKMVVALAHSGWKGTMGRIAANTVDAMCEYFQSRPRDIEVFIGPGIGKCCFQIQPDLFEKVSKEFAGFDGIINRNKECSWDLKLTNKKILIDRGINPEKIVDCDLCTSCYTDVFYSHRRENGQTGRMAAVIGLVY